VFICVFFGTAYQFRSDVTVLLAVRKDKFVPVRAIKTWGSAGNYSLLTSELDAVVSFKLWLLYRGENVPGTHYIKDYVRPRTGLDGFKKRKF